MQACSVTVQAILAANALERAVATDEHVNGVGKALHLLEHARVTHNVTDEEVVTFIVHLWVAVGVVPSRWERARELGGWSRVEG